MKDTQPHQILQIADLHNSPRGLQHVPVVCSTFPWSAARSRGLQHVPVGCSTFPWAAARSRAQTRTGNRQRDRICSCWALPLLFGTRRLAMGTSTNSVLPQSASRGCCTRLKKHSRRHQPPRAHRLRECHGQKHSRVSPSPHKGSVVRELTTDNPTSTVSGGVLRIYAPPIHFEFDCLARVYTGVERQANDESDAILLPETRELGIIIGGARCLRESALR
jgi:hypothetical protein